MSLVLVGLNHKTATVEIRERVAYSQEEAAQTLRRLKSDGDVPQGILLSTCNRTELYAMLRDPEALPRVTDRLFTCRGLDPAYSNGTIYVRTGEEVIQHLFRVACGLDSMVLGEQEILGQVKTAYEVSKRADTLGTIFHKLAARAFHIGKRARTETRIGLGAISVAYAAVELTEKVLGSLEGKGALLIGTGENGALCAQHLLSRGVSPLLLANRTVSKAEALAQRLGGETFDLGRGLTMIDQVDVVVCTTAAPDPVVKLDHIRRAMSRREGRALVLVDIAVPRDIDPRVDEIPNVFRFDMDAMESIVQKNREVRAGEVPNVERLVEAEVAMFVRWMNSLNASPVIRDLHHAFHEVRDQEIQRQAKRFQAEDREQLEVFTQNLVRKLLTPLTLHLKELRRDDPRDLEKLAILREMFGLEDEELDDGDSIE